MIWTGRYNHFISDKTVELDDHKAGKWIYFPYDLEFAKKICEKAHQDGIGNECKYSMDGAAVFFYCNSDDIKMNYKSIDFMMANRLIRKTKSGRYYNISFKFDDQTMMGQYGADFERKVRLSDFINLDTGEHIRDEDLNHA